jgi:hypothetical protein
MRPKVHHLGTNVVRLTPEVFIPVQRLARLAGVSASAIVEFLLSEVFRDDSLASELQPARPEVPAHRATPRPPRPASVIPLWRARTARLGIGGPALAEIRAHARELCRHAREARGRAATACRRAARARALADEVMAAHRV